MSRYVLALALFCAAAPGAAGLTAEEPRKVPKAGAKKLAKLEIAQMMKDTHHGPKTPDARIVAELKKDTSGLGANRQGRESVHRDGPGAGGERAVRPPLGE